MLYNKERIPVNCQCLQISLLVNMLPVILALLLQAAAVWSFDCGNSFVCDPSVGTDIFIQYTHLADEDQCEQSCQIDHPSNPCKFFTWVPDTEEPNCFHMSECIEKGSPSHGEKSGAWSCEDESLFCQPLGTLPSASNTESHWLCDHGVFPYGNATVFQDVVCRTS